VWAHEYGHRAGLHHRDDDPDALMNSHASTFSRKVNVRECTAYHLFPGASAVEVSTPRPATIAATTIPAPLPDIRDFVRQLFIHGIPHEETMRYNSSVVPTLLDMLADTKEQQAWPNIVIVLGMLGDDRAVTPLISLIEQSADGEINYFQYEAKKNAILGLGYLVNKSGNQTALTYLRDGLAPSVWAERGVTWTSPDQEAATERDRELTRMTIIALGLSGNPSAQEALRELLTPAATRTERNFRARMNAVISEALNANQRIANEGLSRYYQEAPP
jgi:hypothetical protein